MPLAEDKVTSRHRITAYGPQTITVNDTVYRQSLVLTADTLLSPWPVTSLEELDGEALQPVLASNPAVVLLGTGQQQRFPHATLDQVPDALTIIPQPEHFLHKKSQVGVIIHFK